MLLLNPQGSHLNSKNLILLATILLLVILFQSCVNGQNLEVTQPQTVWGAIGEWTEIDCVIDPNEIKNYNDEKFSFTWTLNGTKLYNSDNYIVHHKVDESSSQLQILINNGKMFGGIYTCTANNKMTTISRTFELKRGAKPLVPVLELFYLASTGVAVKDQNLGVKFNESTNDSNNNNTLTLQNFHLPVTNYVVDYKLPKKEFWVRSEDVTKTDYGFTLRHLLPGMTYTVRAASVNPAARSGFSRYLQFTTPQNVPFVAPVPEDPDDMDDVRGQIASHSTRVSSVMRASLMLILSTWVFLD